MQTKTPGTHQATYDAIFQHPVTRNLQWREVHAMLDHLSDTAVEEHNGNFKFTRNGETMSVHPPHRKDFSDIAEVMRIRHFLERSAIPFGAVSVNGDGHRLLVVIDHREARLFRADMSGSVPQRIAPFDPEGANRYLHNVGDDDNGQRKAEPKLFYDAIIRTLKGAEKILILGSSTGASSAMDHLVAELKLHHPAIAKHIVGVQIIDGNHVTDDQLLAQARTFFGDGSRKN